VTSLSSDPKVISAAISETLKEEPVEVTTVAPSDNEVILPGGYVSPGGILAKTAEVRELTGADEEAISRAGSLGKSLTTILQRGVVAIGEEPVGKHTLDDMLSGDRDALLLAIRQATFGTNVEYRAICACGEDQVVDIDLSKDVPIKELDNPIQDRLWTTKTKAGEVVLALPNGSTQKQLVEGLDKTTAELGTVLLAGCVQSIDGKISVGSSSVLNLGMADREKLIAEIVEKNPGPRLGEVKKACQACGEDIETPLSLTALFRLQ
jgi:hypothetical protein